MRDHLQQFQRRPLALDGLRAAAVAITVVGAAEPPHFLLTRRPAHAPRHKNQFALPGGRTEPGETAAQAARRELREELGLSLTEGAVLGELDDYATRSGFVITPVVLWCDRVPELTPDPGEVAELHRVALHTLFDPELVHVAEGPDSAGPILSLRLVGTSIFAPTAALILQFRDVALAGLDTRVASYEQPRFAWQ
ncbi:MAG: CoA pyrophosphatase [Polyangiaceae bacterium]|nr:CoA pyrophosphatase [Polyangiaceae bacterium]